MASRVSARSFPVCLELTASSLALIIISRPLASWSLSLTASSKGFFSSLSRSSQLSSTCGSAVSGARTATSSLAILSRYTCNISLGPQRSSAPSNLVQWIFDYNYMKFILKRFCILFNYSRNYRCNASTSFLEILFFPFQWECNFTFLI